MAVSTGAYHPKPGIQAVGRGEPAQTTPFLPGLGRTLRQKPIKSATQCLHPAAHDSASLDTGGPKQPRHGVLQQWKPESHVDICSILCMGQDPCRSSPGPSAVVPLWG